MERLCSVSSCSGQKPTLKTIPQASSTAPGPAAPEAGRNGATAGLFYDRVSQHSAGLRLLGAYIAVRRDAGLPYTYVRCLHLDVYMS